MDISVMNLALAERKDGGGRGTKITDEFTTGSNYKDEVTVDCGFKPDYIEVILPFSNGDTYAVWSRVDTDTELILNNQSVWYIVAPGETSIYYPMKDNSDQTGIVEILDNGFKFRSGPGDNTHGVKCTFKALKY